MRAAWNTNAIWAAFQAGPYTGYDGAGEQFFDEGSLTIRDQVAFNAAPTLNAMIADAVVRNTLFVSAAGDVQDMAVVILNLIADTPVMTPAIWFRAGVNRIGTIANVGIGFGNSFATEPHSATHV